MQRSAVTPPTTGLLAQTVRRICALVCFVEVVIIFAAAGSAIAIRFRWIDNIEITPIALSVSMTLTAFWLLFTFVFGRIYCSVVCPMGTFMDTVGVINRAIFRPHCKNYFYTRPRDAMRYRWLALMIVLAVCGATVITSIFDPYVAFGRFITVIFKPLADLALGREVVVGSIYGILLSAATFIIVVLVAAFKGRTICNTFCPIGSLLSLPAKRPVYAIDINTDVCTGCGECVKVCKSHCIDMQSHTVDTSRCVVCFDCVAECEPGAISYTRNRHRLSTPLMLKVKGSQTAASLSNPSASQSALTKETSVTNQPSINETISRPTRPHTSRRR